MDTNARPRCRICGRRLKREPGKTLGIGPICAKKWLHVEGARDNYILKIAKRHHSDAHATKQEIDAIDAKIKELVAAGLI
jgi:hypothetical protein